MFRIRREAGADAVALVEILPALGGGLRVRGQPREERLRVQAVAQGLVRDETPVGEEVTVGQGVGGRPLPFRALAEGLPRFVTGAEDGPPAAVVVMADDPDLPIGFVTEGAGVVALAVVELGALAVGQ